MSAIAPAAAAAAPRRPGPATAEAAQRAAASSGALLSPLRPLVVGRRFDPPRQRWSAGHRGVDLVGRAGQVVASAAAGRVAFAGALAGRGVVVVVHGDVRTTYEPVAAGVRVGERVAAGEPLGALDAGHLGCPVGRACLHWGVLRGDVYLDPIALLGVPELRLLPLGPPRPAGGPAVAPASSGGLPGSHLRAPQPAQRSGSASPTRGSPGTTALAAGASALGGALVATAAGAVARSRRRPGSLHVLPHPPATPPPAARSSHLRRVA